jgi:hypothetical protein
MIAVSGDDIRSLARENDAKFIPQGKGRWCYCDSRTASTTQALPVAAFCAAHPLAEVHVACRLSTTELSCQLREFELDARQVIDKAFAESGLGGDSCGHARFPVVARAVVTSAQGLRLAEFFDHTLPIESLVN